MNMHALFIILSIVFNLSIAQARDTRQMYDYEYALKSPEAKAQLGDDVKFEFGTKKHTDIKTDFGEFSSNRKTNAFNKSDEKACIWAFLSAIISLRDQAHKQGANAVIDIRSNYKNHLLDNEKQFECGAGALIAGVALKGRVVTLNK